MTDPTSHESLLSLLASLEPLDEDFPEIDDPPAEPVDPDQAATKSSPISAAGADWVSRPTEI